MNCYMWHIAVESSTLPTRHEVQSTTLSTTRPADFTPFFVEFWVSLRYIINLTLGASPTPHPLRTGQAPRGREPQKNKVSGKE